MKDSELARTLPDLLQRVSAEIETRKLTLKEAAAAIGVGLNTLQNHLAGEHVRSDSARKYEDWLSGRVAKRNVFVLHATPETGGETESVAPLPAPPARPSLVVDIFSGCGGLSLGFDLLGEGQHFRTVLAIDNQPAPIAVLNRNLERLRREPGGVGRVVDLTDFMNAAEFLAFYVAHIATLPGYAGLARELDELCDGQFASFQSDIARADARFIAKLNEIRPSTRWRTALDRLDRQCLGQTSVIAFHDRLRLPRPSLRPAMLPALLWACQTTEADDHWSPSHEALSAARAEWESEVAVLASKRHASGKGQLTSSARRIGAFLDFLEGEAASPMRDAWIGWRAERLERRHAIFADERFSAAVRSLYERECQASILVGGPPCQGFSRIGRGKIRSLRDALVHVHGSEEAGDSRNLLFQQYVMVLEALRPDVFLFENVQHFQSTVRADGVEFQATEVLAEAIANMSEGKSSYEVASRVIDASRHGIPQTRQRYFMAGVRQDSPCSGRTTLSAQACLSLRRIDEAALALALQGLSRPLLSGAESSGPAPGIVPVATPSDGDHPFIGWIRQPAPYESGAPRTVDSHVARTPRADDAAFFALMGPGKRWMDYRADDSETVAALAELLDQLLDADTGGGDRSDRLSRTLEQRGFDRQRLKDMRSRLDGALPLRLLLEQQGVRLGAPHHLLTESYLAKRDGNHGDWVARMDATRPSKTMVSHMGKDTYAYVHPWEPRTISVREAARIQSFPDWFTFEGMALTDAFKMIGNAVPPMLSHAIAAEVVRVLARDDAASADTEKRKVLRS